MVRIEESKGGVPLYHGSLSPPQKTHNVETQQQAAQGEVCREVFSSVVSEECAPPPLTFSGQR